MCGFNPGIGDWVPNPPVNPYPAPEDPNPEEAEPVEEVPPQRAGQFMDPNMRA